MPVKLTLKQYRILAIALAVAAASLAIGMKYFSQAFPEAAIQFRVNRSGSARIAQQFLTEQGIHVAGYRHAAIFGYDDTSKLYLERTQGLKRMDQLTRGPLHLWRWYNRWFKPQQKEEFRVDVSPSGQVVGFDHEIQEAAPGANLSQDGARKLAETFLTRVMKRDLEDLDFLDAERIKRPARTDYSFTWKQKRVNLGNGSLRFEVDVNGDRVMGYQEFVKIPEDWTRGYQKLRSRNIAAQIVDQVFWVLLSIAMLVIFVRRLRDHDVPLRLALGLGAGAAALAFLSQVNMFPVTEFSYSTTDSFSSFLSGYFFDALMGALGLGVLIFLVVGCAEPVYRESFPGFVSFRRYFSWRGLRSRSFFMANVIGIALTFFFFAYQTVFYLAANHFGAWAPSDISFSNELNTRIPWVAVLFAGFFPAVSEEMQFRAFAIPFLKKVTKSWPLALILAAFNWGFLHSAYPNQPFFIRGVEVGLGGVIVGIIMLRFGILAALMWHYSVDALYTAFLLLRSVNHYLMISGGLCAGIMLIPLIVALAAYAGTGTFTEEAGLSNEHDGMAREPRAEAPSGLAPQLDYRPLSRRRLAGALSLAAVFVAISFVKAYRLGEGIKVHITRAQALQVAGAFLQQRHINARSYRAVAWLHLNIDPLAVRYLLERRSVRETDLIVREASRPLLWEVRFFRPLQKEEHLVFVDAASGRVFADQHPLDESAPGATLSAQQARALGEKAVVGHGYNLSDFVLQDSRSQRRPAREDYTLIWQAKSGDPRNVAEARYRLRVNIAGDQVVSFARYFKLPEQWIRQQESRGLANSALLGVAILFGAGLVAGALWLFVRQVRQGAMRWIAALKVAVALAIVLALSELNQLDSIDRAYNTSVSFSNFRLQVSVSLIVSLIVAGVLIWLAVTLATSLYPKAWQILRASSRRVWRRDAAVALVVSLAVSWGLEKLLVLLESHFHACAPASFAEPPQQFDAFLPGLGIFFHAVVYGVAGAAVLGVAIYGVCLGWKRKAWWFWLGGILLLIALGAASAHSAAQYAVVWLTRFIPLLAGVVILALFFRDNLLAYVVTAFCSVIAEPLVELLAQPAPFSRWNGVLLAVLTAIVLIWSFLPRRRGQLLKP